MGLSAAQKQEFLAQPHIAAMAIAEPGRGPLTVPIWYAYDVGGKPWITTLPGSRKIRAVRAAGRFTLMVETLEPRIQYVSVEGPVASITTSTQDEIEAMAARYLRGEALTGYLEYAATLGEHVTVVLEPENWLGADLSA